MTIESDLDAIARQYRPLVYKLALRYTTRDRDQLDDAVQDGYIGLMRAYGKWDPDGGANFLSFAYVGVTNAIFSGLRDRRGKNRRRAQVNGDVAYSEIPLTYGRDGEPREIQLSTSGDGPGEGADPRWEAVSAAIDRLSERERRALLSYSTTGGGAILAAELGVSAQRVSQLRIQAIQRVRRLIGDVA